MILSGLSFRDIEYCVAVADTRSFSRAAETCGVSQPTLSVQVGKLERRLSLQLFERSKPHVLLTGPGTGAIEQMRTILREARTLEALAARATVPFAGRLRLSAIATLGPYVFPHILPGLRRKLDRITLVLSEGLTHQLLESLRAGELDAVLMSLPHASSTLVGAPLFAERFLLACPDGHGACRGGRTGWQALPPEQRLLLEDGHCLRDQALFMCDDGGSTARHGTSLETLKYMVAAGEGCTLMPSLAAHPVPGIEYVDPGDAELSRTIGLVWRRSDPHQEALLRLCGVLRECVAAANLPVSVAAGDASPAPLSP